MRRSAKLLLKGVGIAVLVVAAILLERRYHLSAVLSARSIEGWLEDAGPLAPLAFVFVMAATVVTPAPTFPLDVLAGRFFGPVLGTLYAVTGATLGAMASFLLARWLGRDFVARLLKGHIHFCRACSDMLLTKVVFLVRLVPAVSFDLVSYGAGLTRMSLTRFALASFLGMLPLTFLYASVGPLLSIGRTTVWIGGAAAVALLLLLPRWIERYNLLGLRHLFEHEDEPGAEAGC